VLPMKKSFLRPFYPNVYFESMIFTFSSNIFSTPKFPTVSFLRFNSHLEEEEDPILCFCSSRFSTSHVCVYLLTGWAETQT